MARPSTYEEYAVVLVEILHYGALITLCLSRDRSAWGNIMGARYLQHGRGLFNWILDGKGITAGGVSMSTSSHTMVWRNIAARW